MERVLSQDERIKRAEEIYARRQSLRDKTKKATLNVADEDETRKIRIFRRISLQIIICILIYFIFYLIGTTNYSFSEETISKTYEIVSYDFDFMALYDNTIKVVNDFINSLNSDIQEEKEDNEEYEEEQVEEQEESEEESTEQTNISVVDSSDTEKIKSNYSFIVPVTRSSVVRVWDKKFDIKYCFYIS